MTADCLHETVNLIRSRSRRSFISSLDAELEVSLVRNRRRRNSRLRLYARRPETARSIAKAYRGASRSAERREKTTSSRIDEPWDLLERVRTEMKTQNVLHIVDGGDHSLRVPKRQLHASGETQTDIDQQIFQSITEFLSALTGKQER